jgi:hypothetical protein
MAYLQKLRRIIAKRGAQDIVYIDECGFEPEACRRYGWSLRGQKGFGDRSGHRRPRTSLIAARRGKDVLAPMLFSGTANAALVNAWTRHVLCKELRPHSTLIGDNAPLHNRKSAVECNGKRKTLRSSPATAATTLSSCRLTVLTSAASNLTSPISRKSASTPRQTPRCPTSSDHMEIIQNDYNPQAYLTDTLSRIAAGHTINRIFELMPWAFQSPDETAA